MNIPFEGGPRHGERVTVRTLDVEAAIEGGGYYVAHLTPDWVDGEDDHLPESERMRALYIYRSDPPRFMFSCIASLVEIASTIALI